MIVLRRLFPPVFAIAVLLVLAFLPATAPVADPLTVPTPADSTATNPGKAIGTVGGIYSGKAAAQEFPITGTRIASVSVFLGTYRRINQGTAQITIQTNMNGQWHDLATQTIEKATLQDNASYTADFSPPLAVSVGQPVRIVLQSDGKQSDAITWWTNTTWRPDGYTLLYDGQPQEGTARFQIMYAPASGRLFQMLGTVWQRATVFLDPLWRVVLVIGMIVLVAGFVVTGYMLVR